MEVCRWATSEGAGGEGEQEGPPFFEAVFEDALLAVLEGGDGRYALRPNFFSSSR